MSSDAIATPGPWKYDRSAGITDPSGDRILVDGVKIPLGNHADIEEAEANSRLIAEAPAMVEILRRLRRASRTPVRPSELAETMLDTVCKLAEVASTILDRIDGIKQEKKP